DLNGLYRGDAALHRDSFSAGGFEWIDCHDTDQSVISYARRAGGDLVIVVLNFTPVPRHGYRLGVERPGRYRELLNSDSRYYGGSDVGNGEFFAAEPIPWMGRSCSLALTLPPLAALIIKAVDEG
ncbi:MAG: alpha amylase C-terminal domain-containing protein, partial [Rubrivivax sp.]|nr:alpha amylase C-terminal domain-containing protein [Rubrivivax sp.]